jgi:phosphoribosylformylglycinamidine synthase
MIFFFESPQKLIYGVQVPQPLLAEDIQKLSWLFGEAKALQTDKISTRDHAKK